MGGVRLIQTDIQVRSPGNDHEWVAYYDLRWRVLRAPWKQPIGSERDEHESCSEHRIACSGSGKVLGCGRLHRVDANSAQIRYMAVEPAYRRQGVGTRILQALEQAARDWGVELIVLHAREESLPFYQQCGYEPTAKSHKLYESIQHFLMQKTLPP